MDSLDDMKKLGQIGVGRGNASEAVLLKNDFTNLYAVTNEIAAIEMLILRRVDAVLIGEMVVSEMSKSTSIDIKLLEKTNLKLLDSILYIGCSKNISDSEISKWQSVFDKVKAEKFEGLYKKYIENTD